MESVESFMGHGKVDDVLEDRALRRKTRRRVIVIAASSLVLLAAIVGTVVGMTLKKQSDDANSSSVAPKTQAVSIKAVCNVTEYPDSCFSSIAMQESSSNLTDPGQIFKLSLLVAIDRVASSFNYMNQLIAQVSDPLEQVAFVVCQTVLQDAIDHLNSSVSLMEVTQGLELLSPSSITDMRTWLSTAITDQETCLDVLEEVNSTRLGDMKLAMRNSTKFASNSLAIITKIVSLLAAFNIPIHRRLLGFEARFDLSIWVGPADRKLLRIVNLSPNLTVAQDGTGDYKTIKDAVQAIPEKSLSRFVIYIKAGIYKENVFLDNNKWNVMMYGDGKTNSIVTGDLNVVDGTPTFATATFAAEGKGFIARDMGFANTAGPAKQQAVAFRSQSDLSVMYCCAFDAFQDTLYVYANRQLYRDCDITGTVDFIFGNAAAVFQNCTILPRQPLSSQYDTLTAQGKSDPNQNSGISIHKCTITPNGNLTASTYLGRLWKDYSTTVFMESSIGPFLNPKGWIEWTPNVQPPDTIFYGEYMNTGPGSNETGRVNWPGYRPVLTTDQAGTFTVGSFIQGNEWLPQTGVPFDPSLRFKHG
ncbi:hypothetical protein BT93_E0392 [Corymbia citriodora subsp. variegata]|nr:hypothetical protein BT93_E0392 [Corymbia citriodora subsp. variegata]